MRFLLDQGVYEAEPVSSLKGLVHLISQESPGGYSGEFLETWGHEDFRHGSRCWWIPREDLHEWLVARRMGYVVHWCEDTLDWYIEIEAPEDLLMLFKLTWL